MSEITEPRTSRGISWAYRLASGFAIVGLTAGTFCSTVLTNEAGGDSFGAVVTALWIVLMVFGRVVVAPYVPLAIARFGVRPTFLAVKIACAVLWSLTAMALGLNLVGIGLLYATAPVFGALAVVASTLTTLFTGAYISGHEMEGALTRMEAVRGVSVALGALLGGAIATTINPAWGLLARGLFEIPLIVVLVVTRPARDPDIPRATPAVWRDLRTDIASNPRMRRLVLLGVGLTIFALPLSELIVPIASDLRQSPLVSGAAIMLASIALGQSLSVFPVTWLTARLPKEKSAIVMAGARGVALLVYCLASLALTGSAELAAWAVIGLGLGMAGAASGALMVGALVKTVPRNDAARAIVAFAFCCTLASPVGLMLWGIIIDFVSVEAALAVGALGVFAFTWWAWRRERVTA